MEEAASIESALAYLTSAAVRNFYATVLNSLERVPAPGFNTMAVAAHRGRYILCYDPEFVKKVSFEELLATAEHEVLHIILHHIPRYLRLRKLWEGTEDEHLFHMCSNTASDLADNDLLRDNHPKLALPEKPLGYWILPEQFDPQLPRGLDYEKYHILLTKLFRSRLQTEASQLYKIAKKILEQQQKNLQNALNNAYPPPAPSGDEGEPQQGPSAGQKPEDGEGNSADGQGQSQGQSQGQGQGQGQGQDQSDSNEELDLENLDPIDQLAVKLMLNSMIKHMAWDAAADLNKKESQEGDPHKLEEHGRQIVSEVVKNTRKSRGTVPSNLAEIIRKMLAPPTVPWTQFLHNIVQHTRQTKKQRGMARPSKKLSAFKVYAHTEIAANGGTDAD